ncbi:MAG: ABC transporter ATP-binding protein [Gammaproteobacteria bacterium]|nr:ABC transporter ATP-binding protein [Gammaproteobacteria bacterium]
MQTAAPIVEVRSLAKDYGAQRAVDNVSFNIMQGEILGLLGPNGSGKSTILRILAGYLAPSEGSVTILGFDHATDSAEARRCLGYVPEDANLYPQMLVSEFLSFMGGLKGLRGSALRSGLARVIEELNLGSVARRAIGKLSHGYRQRVAIAQALINRPPLVIFDEPTNGLDPHQIIEVRELVRRLAPDQTILITSHVLGEIERIATRVAVLLNGKLLTERVAATAPRVILRIQGLHLEKAEALLTLIAGVTNVQARSPGGFTNNYELTLQSAEFLPGIAPAVLAAGYALLELREIHLDLEAAFLALTGSER